MIDWQTWPQQAPHGVTAREPVILLWLFCLSFRGETHGENTGRRPIKCYSLIPLSGWQYIQRMEEDEVSQTVSLAASGEEHIYSFSPCDRTRDKQYRIHSTTYGEAHYTIRHIMLNSRVVCADWVLYTAVNKSTSLDDITRPYYWFADLWHPTMGECSTAPRCFKITRATRRP